MRTTGKHVSRSWVTATTLAILTALIAATAALAASRTSANYFFDYRSPGQGAGSVYDHQGCWSNYGSFGNFNNQSIFTTGFMTVAIIDANGNWRRSLRVGSLGNSGNFSVQVSPDTLAQAQSYDKKAHCVNSGSTLIHARCDRQYWTGISCV